jgi:hypothetical protein
MKIRRAKTSKGNIIWVQFEITRFEVLGICKYPNGEII